MSNIIARSFLNDGSNALLESSEGAKNVIIKKREIDDFKKKEIDARVELEQLLRESSENNEAICEIRGIGFFGRLFKKKEIEAKLARLEGVKRKLDNDINATVERIELIEKILGRLQTEFSKYAEELAKVGLTPEDIISEYNLIKQELAEKAQVKDSSKKPESKQVKEDKMSESKPIKSTTETKQSTRISPIDRFNDRMRKYQEMQAKKTDESKQEKQ